MGTVPLPEWPAKVLELLRASDKPQTVKQLHRAMPRSWRQRHTYSNVSRYLGQLQQVGAARMVGKRSRAVLWAPVEATL